MGQELRNTDHAQVSVRVSRLVSVSSRGYFPKCKALTEVPQSLSKSRKTGLEAGIAGESLG